MDFNHARQTTRKRIEPKTPTINAIIHLSEVICGRDFWKEGRTVERLGMRERLRAMAAEHLRGVEPKRAVIDSGQQLQGER